MNRFIVVKGLSDLPSGTSGAEVANWLVVDTTAAAVYADCGDSQGRANTTAAALNAYVV